MSFSLRMRDTTTNLLEKLGNSCVLTKVTVGAYDTTTGTTRDTIETVNTHSTSLDNSIATIFSAGVANANLAGFGEDSLMIPYQDGYTITTDWLYNGHPINELEELESQNNIIAYIIEVGTS